MSNPAEVRRWLLDSGYSPLPCQGKMPIMKDWQRHAGVSPVEIETWTKRYPLAVNTGILTARVPVFDVDLLDAEAAAAVEALVRERFEESGIVPVRFGSFPKRALPFRTDAPFAKLTVKLTAPDGSEGQRLELMGDGQQIIVDGVNPDTKRPYAWHGGVLSEIKRADLGYMHEHDARELIDAAAELLIREFSYRLPQKRAAAPANGIDEPADWVVDFADHDATAALSMKLLKSGMRDGAAVNFLRAGVDSLANIDPDRRERRFKEIPGMVASARAKLEDGQPQSPNQGEPASSNEQLES